MVYPHLSLSARCPTVPSLVFHLFHQSCIHFPCVWQPLDKSHTENCLNCCLYMPDKIPAPNPYSNSHQHVFVHKLRQMITDGALCIVTCSCVCVLHITSVHLYFFSGLEVTVLTFWFGSARRGFTA